MLTVKETIIKKVDLKKIMKERGIKTFYQLSKIVGIKANILYAANKGRLTLSDANWQKIKQWL